MSIPVPQNLDPYVNDYIPKPEKLVHVQETLQLLSVMTGDHRFEDVFNEAEKEELHTMCEVLDRIESRGIAQGMAQGMAQGRSEGRAEQRTKDIRTMLNMHRTPQQIAEFCGYELSEVLKVQADMSAQV